MTTNPDIYHDAAEDNRASYWDDPVDHIEPEEDREPSREEQLQAIKAEAAILGELFRFISDPIKSTRND